MPVAAARMQSATSEFSFPTRLFERIGCGMMPQIGCDIHVDAAGTHLVEHGVARSREHGDRTDGSVKISRNLNAILRVR